MPTSTPEPSVIERTEGSDPPTNGHDAQPATNGAPLSWPGLDIVDVRPDLGQLPPGASPGAAPKRGRGRPAGSKTRRLNPDAPQDIPGPRPTVITAADYRGMAMMTVRTTTGLATQVLGPEWQPTEAEDGALVDATENYFRAKGIPDIPPGWILFFVCCTYALPRLNSPTMREKLGKVGDSVKSMMGMGKRAPSQ